MSGFPSRNAGEAEPIPIGSCVPLTRSTNNHAFLPVGSLIERARYPQLSARYPRVEGLSSTTVTVAQNEYRFSATDGLGHVLISCGVNGQPGLFSADGGLTWTNSALPNAPYWSGVAYGGGRWVIVRPASNAAAYSSDGINWTGATLPSSAGWYHVVFGGGRFVSGPYDSAITAYSDDGGGTWSAGGSRVGGSAWGSLAFGGGRFVSLADGGTYACYSDDFGASWTAATTLPVSGYWVSTQYVGGRFVAVPYNGTSVLSSPDGITWSVLGTLPATRQWSLAGGDSAGVLFAYARDVNECATSPDGVTWTLRPLPNNGTPSRVATGIGSLGRIVLPAGVNGKIDLVVPDSPGATHMLLGGPAGYHVRVR